jgi:hypothetical protein
MQPKLVQDGLALAEEEERGLTVTEWPGPAEACCIARRAKAPEETASRGILLESWEAMLLA